ncbi:MAG: DUF1810 domain-containing protein [Fimbriiglobus sp.]|jgi:uncharacterized protein (DUF1810 family)|nr:DUF1810 domain-containing protein [Fimbriiglobus sp.]
MSADPFDLARFVSAQAVNYADALAEIRAGHKVSHWMWYVFPQFAGLGQSEMARRYAITAAAEAEAYLAHPVLGPRLAECCEALLAVEGKSAHAIFDTPDDLKLRSSVTLFAAVAKGGVFGWVLDKYFGGDPDPRTLKLLGVS